jgi:phosphoglycolate phosphatase
MKKLVIFDLDGTLLDTIADLAESANYALKQLGYPTHNMETIRTFVGNGINKLLERALPTHEQTAENVMRMRSHFVPYYDVHNADLSAPYPGTVHLLENFQAKGIQLAVASNKYQAATVKLVKQYFPTIDFVEILGQREGINVKPDPTIVFDILKKANVSREETLYVGDSGVDMQTAINAGVDAVGVTWGFRPRAELKNFQPMGLIDKAEELLEFI